MSLKTNVLGMPALLMGKHTLVNLVHLQGFIKGIDSSTRLAFLAEILLGLILFFFWFVGWLVGWVVSWLVGLFFVDLCSSSIVYRTTAKFFFTFDQWKGCCLSFGALPACCNVTGLLLWEVIQLSQHNDGFYRREERKVSHLTPHSSEGAVKAENIIFEIIAKTQSSRVRIYAS